MEDIRFDQSGRIVEGEHAGYFLRVHHDTQETFGFYVFVVDDLENPSDGCDYWAKDAEELGILFRTSEWEIRWLQSAE